MNKYFIFSPLQVIKFHFEADVLLGEEYVKFERMVEEVINPNLSETNLKIDSGEGYIISLVLKKKGMGVKMYITNSEHMFVNIETVEGKVNQVEVKFNEPIWYFEFKNKILIYTSPDKSICEIVVDEYPYKWETDVLVDDLGIIRDKKENIYKVFKI